jgi:hypothetical protein
MYLECCELTCSRNEIMSAKLCLHWRRFGVVISPGFTADSPSHSTLLLSVNLHPLSFLWYKTACQHCLTFQTNNGHISIGRILRHHVQGSQQHIVQSYLRRVRGVTWNRSFIKGDPLGRAASQECGSYHSQLVGFGPPKTAFGDIIATIYGCSVPVILRLLSEYGEPHSYHFVGEAYIYGKMDGEAFEEHHQTKTFKLL